MNTDTQSFQKDYQKGFKYRLKLNKDQVRSFEKAFGCSRKIWNLLLDQAIKEYAVYDSMKDQNPDYPKPDVSPYGFEAKATVIKNSPGYEYLNEPIANGIFKSAHNLGVAYQNFFKKKSGFPKFKKKVGRQSFTLTNIYFKVEGDRLFLAKRKDSVKIILHRPLPSKPSQLTVSRNSSGEYYVSFLCKYVPEKLTSQGVIGVDLGLDRLMTFSNEVVVPNPRFYRQAESGLRRSHKDFSRKQKGSNNRKKANKRLAKRYKRVANQQDYHAHKHSRNLVNNNQVVGFENLNVDGMRRNRRLAKSISGACWGKTTRYAEYKAKESGNTTIVYVSRFFPSTHTCSVTMKDIGFRLKMSQRSFKCPQCGSIHDRDINAAKSIVNMALSIYVRHPSRDKAGLVIKIP